MSGNVVQQEFDSKAGEYESNRLAQWYKAHANEIIEHCPVIESGAILDIGCASGYQLRLLSDLSPSADLVGIDLSPKMIEQANALTKKASGKFTFLSADFENLSDVEKQTLDKFQFKLIVCANCFHYFNYPDKAINQMFQMLDTNGILLILEREKSNSLLTLFWGFLHRYFIKDQVEFYTADDIRQLLLKSGFKHTKVIKTIRKYFWKGKLFTSIALIKGNK